MSELDNIQEISETAFHTPATGVTPPPPVPVTVTSASTSPTESTSVPAGVTEPTSTPSPQPNLLSPVPQRVVRSVSPDIRAATPLEHQVAGHAGVMADESGELVIKVGRGVDRVDRRSLPLSGLLTRILTRPPARAPS